MRCKETKYFWILIMVKVEKYFFLHNFNYYVQYLTFKNHSMNPIRLAIFASGSGSNAENIYKYFSGNDKVEIALILSDKSQAFVHQRARSMGVISKTLQASVFRESDEVLSLLKEFRIDFIVLAGFLLLMPPKLVQAFPNKIVNIHPALLPKYGGKGMYGDRVHQAVVLAGEKQTGITIHYVNEKYDEGRVIFQATCQIEAADTFEDVARKVHALEYKHYPKVIELILAKEFEAYSR